MGAVSVRLMRADAPEVVPEEFEPLVLAFLACRTGFWRIKFFREVAMAGRNVAGQDMFNRHYERLLELAKNDPPEVLQRSAGLVSQMTVSAITEAQATIDAASLVFAHSILDDVVSECCGISFRAAPVEWEATFEQRKVSLSQVKGQTYDSLLLSLGEQHVENLKREPLMKRLDIINSKCQPAPPFIWKGQQYAYDRDRVEELDTRRHQIIHHPAVGQKFPDVEGDISFLHATSQFIMWMTSQRYSITDQLLRFGA